MPSLDIDQNLALQRDALEGAFTWTLAVHIKVPYKSV